MNIDIAFAQNLRINFKTTKSNNKLKNTFIGEIPQSIIIASKKLLHFLGDNRRGNLVWPNEIPKFLV